MDNTTRLGAGLLVAGVVTARAAGTATTSSAVRAGLAAGLLAGACSALGAATLITRWASGRAA